MQETIDETTKATLDAIESLLVAQRLSVRDALIAANRLGVLVGMLERGKDFAPVIEKILQVMEVFKPDA
jgi:hypothetical protein